MNLVLDAGAFVAIERNNRFVYRQLAIARQDKIAIRTSALVVAQVWRGGAGRQVPLAQALRGVAVLPVDHAFARRIGSLCGDATSADPVDAAVALLALDGDRILTSDPDDLTHLAKTLRRRCVIIKC